MAATRDEDECELRRPGGQVCGLSLATGEGQGSWRTRHRAAILRSALQRGEWELGHLTGKEFVADSFTKVVDEASFTLALQDLGAKAVKPLVIADWCESV